MAWKSGFSSAQLFCSTLKEDPLRVFVVGRVDGRLTPLSIQTALEIDGDLRVVGHNLSWMVSVRSEGRKIIPTVLRIKASRPMATVHRRNCNTSSTSIYRPSGTR